MNQKIIIFDFEIFMYDYFLGALVLSMNEREIEYFKSWDKDEIINFYSNNLNALWIGHNNQHYDNHILEAIVKGKNPYKTSVEIVEYNKKKYLNLPLIYFDLMSERFASLKAIECAVGKKISESEIDFKLDRKLTKEEKEKIEYYNFDDLEQTFDNFIFLQSVIMSRFEMIDRFDLPINCLNLTKQQVTEKILGAKRIHGIENWVVKPKIYDNLQIKNKEVLDYYLKDEFRTSKKVDFMLCGVMHRLGSGGLHGARAKYHSKQGLYFDVSGYYNLIMIKYDLLPRSIPTEYRKYYHELYLEQLALKKIDPIKREALKVPLLAVFGAMMFENSSFYDPYNGLLVTITGQLFLIDLLEKLEGLIELGQSNTDGIVADILPGVKEETVLQIIKDWEKRTGFTIKPEKIYNIHQRDVNNYMFVNDKGEVHVKGEALKYYEHWENPLEEGVYNSKEPVVIHYAIVEYFLNNKQPEEVINNYKENLRMYQYCAKPNSFDYLEYQENFINGEIEITKLQKINRVFALKSHEKTGMVYKVKPGKRAKGVESFTSVFIYNEEILSKEAIDKLIPQIDYNYYIDRSKERILDFINHIQIKEIDIWQLINP